MVSPNLIERSLELAAERCENLRPLVYRRRFREHPEDEATSRELFVAFFGVIAETLHEIIGADWSPEIDAAWPTMLGEIGGIVARSCLRPSPFHLGPIVALLSWNCFALFALPGIGWPVTAMRARKQSLVSALIGHFTMGVALGLGFVLLISLIDRFGVRDLVAHSDAPFGTMSVIVGSFALMFGIGATLTGLLMTMEDDG